MHHHLAVPPCLPAPPLCLHKRGGVQGDRAIGREPVTDMKRSGMEVSTAGEARARHRHGAKRSEGEHCGRGESPSPTWSEAEWR